MSALLCRCRRGLHFSAVVAAEETYHDALDDEFTDGDEVGVVFVFGFEVLDLSGQMTPAGCDKQLEQRIDEGGWHGGDFRT